MNLLEPLNDLQAAKVDDLIELDWEMERLPEFTGAVAGYKATKQVEGEGFPIEMYVAVRPDGSHKFYRNLRRMK